MQLTLIKNPDETKGLAYKIARVVYAETQAASLRVVEALTSMIQNRVFAFGHTPEQCVKQIVTTSSSDAGYARQPRFSNVSACGNTYDAWRFGRLLLGGNVFSS